ncbi:pyridoxine 5'-phosphate synthase [Sulfurospirillum arcachonense]|uniref:pyridoxine 5'-phosphate synthase n=1 Tax=Sulfurospirillum arcachonense TaxID=57666 RepID=UPI000468DF64|nr:pyridoxine 5'-phosphate synthase [Sulfurospirillum arcachonense]
MLLGVNIDHIAVLREARKINDPDPLDAVSLVKRAGADQITIHLREDRRHINDMDAVRIIENSQLPINMECAIAADIIDTVIEMNPHRVTLVPEKREEVTTEGGLDVIKNFQAIKDISTRLEKANIELSVFIDPDILQIKMAKSINAQWIELHTGHYANVYAMLYSNLKNTHHSIKDLELSREQLRQKLDDATKEIQNAAQQANDLGLKVAAGHGLNYQNVKPIADIKEIIELNIGQSIIARSVFTGFECAVKEMIDKIN